MHRRRLVVPSIALLIAIALVPAATAAPAQVGRYIVVLRQGTDAASVAREHAARFGAQVGFIYTAAIDGYAAAIPDARLEMLRADPRVLSISDDREVAALGAVVAADRTGPGTARAAKGPGGTPTETVPTGIKRAQAPSGLAGASGIDHSGAAFVVAVIDTGIDPTHPDLNVIGGKNCSSGSTWADGNGHGSHVAGTIGAKMNGQGVVGMAPGIPLLAVRVLNNAGSGSWSGVVCGIDWVTANAGGTTATGGKKIRIANMSLGGTGSDNDCGDALHLAICNATAAGVLFTVAAGNSAADFSNFVPATYSEVLTVTAMADFDGVPGGLTPATCGTDQDDTAADFSNWATTSNASDDKTHTIVAPGVCIRSTYKGGGYATMSGTSMASPHAAGAAALYLLKNANANVSAIKSGVLNNANVESFKTVGTRFFGNMLDAGF